MAQAFKFPTEARIAIPALPLLPEPPQARYLRIAAPDRSGAAGSMARIWAGHRLAASVQRHHPMRQQRPIPIQRSGARLINPDRFDKNFSGAI
ncbi:MAG: hypothetical protein HY852_24010 [Bradyrhizobium sp.]|uniref:hypothetical protein n=1 Tax=Bradyrhizobium sp. TaxID=376 RepID=UPI0025BA0D1C|nr:hypothetical protein [Bradyrhizobium sp.]MBI5264872.1 hypothetical protein [Bradyrhizobium sp.]